MAKSGVSGQIEGRKSNRSWWWTRAEVDLGFPPATVDLSTRAIWERANTGGGAVWALLVGLFGGSTSALVGEANPFGDKFGAAFWPGFQSLLHGPWPRSYSLCCKGGK